MMSPKGLAVVLTLAIQLNRTSPLNLSRRDALLLGGGAGIYTKVAIDIISRADDKRPAEHEDRVRSTFYRAVSDAAAALSKSSSSSPSDDDGTPLRVLEVGIGRDCRSIFRGYYDGIVAIGGGRRSIELTGVDLELPTATTITRARDRLRAAAVDDDDGAVTWDFDVTTGDVCQGLSSYPDGHFDAITCCFALCSVSDQAAALGEIRRLLKRGGGAFGYVEHVAVRDGEGRGFFEWQQRVLDPLQQVVAHNCHLHRYTDEVIENVFGGDGDVVERERFFVDGMWPICCQCRGVLTV